MIFALLQKDNLNSIELNHLDYPSMLLTPPIESPFVTTKEAFPFLTDKQVEELEDVGGALILCETDEELKSYYRQIPVIERKSDPICMYFDKYNNHLMQK
jgi:hypothetical protein